MLKEFIPYQEALALKELGFDEPCFGHYLIKKFYKKEYHKQGNGITLRPTYSQAFRWFRKNYKLHSEVIREKIKVDERWVKSKFYTYSIDNEEEFPLSLGFDLKDDATYEETELACLRKLIEIVKEKQ